MAQISSRISILGDSISTFEGYTPSAGVFYSQLTCNYTHVSTVADTWWMQVIQSLRGTLLANHSWAGSTVSRGGPMPACSAQRLASLSVNGIPPDIILIYSGLNDAYTDVPVSFFLRDYIDMLRQLKKSYPQAAIFCGTLALGRYARPGISLSAGFKYQINRFNESIREAVAEVGCHLADLAAIGTEYTSIDGLHPTKTGMKELAALWLSCLQ